MSTSIGTARIDIELSTADYELAINRAKNAAVGFGKDAETAFNTQNGAAKRAATSLLNYVNGIGKTREELKLLKAAGSGVDPAIIGAATKAMNDYTSSVSKAASESEMLKAAMAQDAGINSYLGSLERQIALFGMSTQEMRQYEAATSEVSQKALALAGILDRLENAQAHDNAVSRMTNSLRDQIATLGMSAQALRRYEANVAGVTSEVAPLLNQLDALESKLAFQAKVDTATASLERQIATFGMGPAEIRRYELALDGVGNSVAPLVAELERLENEARQVNATLAQNSKVDSFLNGLRSQADAVGRTNSELLAMQAAQMGVSKQAAPLVAWLATEEKQMEKTRRSYEKGVNAVGAYGLSQKQLEFAMRGVPAQMTDIIVSLQGGQAPLTVLLQQGGQLKDMFGGIKPAASALAGEFMKLVNVYTLSAAALGALVLAYAKAAKEQDEFNRALIQTGSYSASSVAQLRAQAAELDQIAGVTATAAGNALQSIATMGTFTNEQMNVAAGASLRWAAVTGDAVDDTVKKFDKIRKDPVAALKELNATERFLTETQLQRVEALIQEGRHQEAVTEAMRQYSDVVNDRADQIEAKLGGISTAWMNVRRMASEAVDALVQASAESDGAFKRYADGVAGMNGQRQARYFATMGIISPGQAALTYLAGSRGQKPEDTSAEDAAIRNEEALAREKKNMEEWAKVQDRNMSDLTRQLKEEGEIRAAGLAAKLSDVEIENEIELMRARYAKKNTPRGGDRKLENDTQRAALQLFKDEAEIAMATVEANARTTQAAYQAQQISAEAYYSAMRGYAQDELATNERSIQGQIAYLKSSNDTINNRRMVGELEADLAKVRAATAAEMQVLTTQELDGIRKRELEMMRFNETLERSNAAYRAAQDAQVAAVGMGGKEATQVAALTALYTEQADKLWQLELLKRETPGNADKYDAEDASLRAHYAERAKILQESYSQMTIAEADWTNGYRRAYSDLIDETRNLADSTYTFVQGVHGEIGGIFEQLVTTGKASTDDLVSYMLKQLSSVGTNKIMAYLMSMWSPGGNNPYGVQAESIPIQFAKGAAVSSPDLSQYSGQVHNKPQFFAFANGGGVFGEAGPEAIMPLRRTSSGRLGVETMGGGAGAPNVTINLIGAPEGTQVGEMQPDGQGGFTMDVLFAQVEGHLAMQVGNGAGSLNTSIKNRYGLKESV